MVVDWANFTPIESLLGGAMIGLSAALLMLLNGRIAGISGVLGGLLTADGWRDGWRVSFVAGLLAAPVLYVFNATSTSDGYSGQCAASYSWRLARRLWHARGKWLHEWSWCVRNIAWFSPLNRRDVDIHGGGLRDGFRYQTSVGRLACEI